jgi:uncharacterized protein
MTLQITQHRQQKDQYFRHNPQSPIPAKERQNFAGLKYYDYNPDLVFELEPEEFAEKEAIQMQTSTGDLRNYLRWGRIQFSVKGETATLTIYFSPERGHYFLPFMDASSGSETYGAGRYLDPHIEEDGTILLDFNLAYSPLCAYNDNYSCPIPPAENRLKIRIEAGEKNYHG